MESRNGNESMPTRRRPLTRRALIKTSALVAASSGLAMPAIAQGISGEIAFATFEWTLPHTGGVLRKITQAFMKKYPNVTVREIPIPASGYADQIFTQLTAGTPPDIFRIEDAPLALYLERGFLIPLDDALAQAGVDTSKFVPAAKDAVHNGKTYGIVYQTNPRALIYNKALLANAGISGPPKDAAQLEDYVKRATSRERGTFGYTIATKSGDISGMMISIMPFVLGMGGNFTTPDGKPSANTKPVIEGISMVKRFWDANCVPRGLDGPAANKLVLDGKVALTINGSFAIGASMPEVKPNLDAVASPMPSGVVLRGTTFYGVTAKGKNNPATTAWLMYMLTPESQATIAEIERVVPALPGFIPQALYEQTPWYKAFVEAAATSVSFLPPGLGSKAFGQMKVIADELELVLFRDKPVDKAMADLQQTLEANLSK
jgi:ABC-type glycerol-3-phosphate transport system substrate-binding protein